MKECGRLKIAWYPEANNNREPNNLVNAQTGDPSVMDKLLLRLVS